MMTRAVSPLIDRNIMRVATAHGSIRSSLVVLAATATSLAGLALPAQAADATVNDITALQTATSSCANGDVITIGADIAASTATITTGCTMTLDLNGRSLSVSGVVITPGTTLTIDGGTAGTGQLSAVATTRNAAGIRTAGAALVIDSGTIIATGYRDPYDFEGMDLGGAGIGGSSTFNAMSDAGTTTINGGTVTATAGLDAAGIGGGPYGDGGITTVNGGTVTATGKGGGGTYGDGSGSGIGGGVVGNGGTTTITGGTVDVSGGIFAAGIGGGNGGDGGTTTVGAGARLTATGGLSGPGIGSGPRGDGKTTVIEQGADVTARGGPHQNGGNDISGIGPGAGYEAEHPFGTLSVAGTLRIPTGANLTVPVDGSAAVTSTGLITGSTDETDGGQLYGPGTIDNGGSIVLPDAQVIDASTPASVTDHHYAVSFDTQGGSAAPSPVTVFAGSFSAGERTFPVPPTKTGVQFTGWNSKADGSGVPIDATSTLPGAATSGPLAVTAYAQYVTPPVVDPTPAAAGPSPTIAGLAPSVTGTSRERKVLAANPGTVSPAGTTFTYQWLSEGEDIPGATAQTFTPGKKQAGHRVSVRITAASSGAPTVTRTSALTPRISSPYKRIALADRSIHHGQTFRVVATGFVPGQKIRVWLGGTAVTTVRADSTGTVNGSVRFPDRTQAGSRRVRVSGYTAKGQRTGTIHTQVAYRR